MNIKLELPQLTDLKPRLTVIGIGGAGCNAVNNMIAAGLTGVEFVVANTDAQTLEASSAEHRIQLGISLTEGLGAGANPEIGEAAAEEAIDEIKAQISGSHMVFLAAGMGGGTGTGAIPVIARVSREMGILTVGVVTKPFQFEGSRRMRMAEAGIAELRRNVDTMIVIPNQNLFRVANEKTTFAEAFLLADQVLYSGVACIVDLIVREGLINLDFADVRAVMRNMGSAMMGTGEGSGECRAIEAAEEAIANPLLDDVSLQGAKGLLLSITGGANLTLYEVDEAASRVRKEVDPEANIIVGATFDHTMEDRVRVSIVASGMDTLAANAGPNAASSGLDGLDAIRRAQDSNGLPPNLPVPPPVPADRYRANGEDRSRSRQHDFGGSEAAHAGHRQPDNWTSVAPPRGEPAPARHPVDTPVAVPANTSALWRSPEGVTIETGPDSQRQATRLPPHDVADINAGNPDGTFEPRQTEAIRRQPRRLLDVEDFPPHARREYYAKRDPETGRQTSAQDEQKVSRKQRLMERLTGRSRKQSDSVDSPVAEAHYRNAQNNTQQHSDRTDEATGSGHASPPASADDRQAFELPVFFGGSRARR